MKTVMKKMFSLLLVAVMLVGVMPFQAFATENTPADAPKSPVSVTVKVFIDDTNKDSYNKTITLNSGDKKELSSAYALSLLTNPSCRSFDKWTVSDGTVLAEGAYITYDGVAANPGYTLKVYFKTSHTEVTDEAVAATCAKEGKTEGKHCSVCQEVLVPQTVTEALNHEFGPDGKCTREGCNEVDPKQTTAARKDINWEYKHEEGGAVIRSGSFTPKEATASVENILYHKVFEKNTAEQNKYTVTKVWSNKEQRDVGTNANIAEGDTVTFVLTPKKDSSDNNNNNSNNNNNNSNSNNSNSNNNNNNQTTGSSKVKVYVNLYTGDVLTKTEPLVVYNEDPNTSISDSITEHKDQIHAALDDKYSGYSWSGNVYDSENEDGENMNSKVGKGINVHINAHSKENIVYLYVHNARTYDRIGIVRLHGKKVGEAVKESEVRKAVKEYFSFSSLKMYDTEKWDLYVDGEDVKSDDTLTVGSNHYVIDVKISGSAKNTSGAKADSSNPKTGDAIFAPAAVLGLSATTLAVLFYLNKKRAY